MKKVHWEKVYNHICVYPSKSLMWNIVLVIKIRGPYHLEKKICGWQFLFFELKEKKTRMIQNSKQNDIFSRIVRNVTINLNRQTNARHALNIDVFNEIVLDLDVIASAFQSGILQKKRTLETDALWSFYHTRKIDPKSPYQKWQDVLEEMETWGDDACGMFFTTVIQNDTFSQSVRNVTINLNRQTNARYDLTIAAFNEIVFDLDVIASTFQSGILQKERTLETDALWSFYHLGKIDPKSPYQMWQDVLEEMELWGEDSGAFFEHLR